jgi:hypothetical protein
MWTPRLGRRTGAAAGSRWGKVWPVLLLCIGGFLIYLAVFLLPPYLVGEVPQQELDQISDIDKKLGAQDSRTKLRNDVRTTLVQAVGGVVLAVGAFSTWRTLQHQRASALREHRLSMYTEAIGQLANNNMEVRVGAIYTLESLARADESYRLGIWQLLTAFARKAEPPRPGGWAAMTALMRGGRAAPEDRRSLMARAPDRQAAITALGRRTQGDRGRLGPHDGVQLDLRKADLRGADLQGLDLRHAVLIEARLDGSQLQGCLFVDADLRNARLSGATSVLGAHFEGAHLEGAHLDRIRNLRRATWTGAIFDSRTNFQGSGITHPARELGI